MSVPTSSRTINPAIGRQPPDAVFGAFAGLGVLSAVIAKMAAIAVAILSISELRYGEFVHLGRWLRKAPRQRALIAADLKLEELSEKVQKARSLTELRILLSENFVSMGFQSARLNVRSYDSAFTRMLSTPASLGLSLPLYADDQRLGVLDLRWDVAAGNWPFDPEFFVSGFLPSLCERLKTFGLIYRELPARAVPILIVAPGMLSIVAAERVPSSHAPLDC